jgi:hypothetical protein
MIKRIFALYVLSLITSAPFVRGAEPASKGEAIVENVPNRSQIAEWDALKSDIEDILEKDDKVFKIEITKTTWKDIKGTL